MEHVGDGMEDGDGVEFGVLRGKARRGGRSRRRNIVYAGWEHVLLKGVVPWNMRGMWHSRKRDRDRKLGVLIELLRRYKIVCVQEPHLTEGNWGGFQHWLHEEKIHCSGHYADDVQEGVIMLSYTPFADMGFEEARWEGCYQLIVNYEVGLVLGNVHLSPKGAAVRVAQIHQMSLALRSIEEEWGEKGDKPSKSKIGVCLCGDWSWREESSDTFYPMDMATSDPASTSYIVGYGGLNEDGPGALVVGASHPASAQGAGEQVAVPSGELLRNESDAPLEAVAGESAEVLVPRRLDFGAVDGNNANGAPPQAAAPRPGVSREEALRRRAAKRLLDADAAAMDGQDVDGNPRRAPHPTMARLAAARDSDTCWACPRCVSDHCASRDTMYIHVWTHLRDHHDVVPPEGVLPSPSPAVGQAAEPPGVATAGAFRAADALEAVEQRAVVFEEEEEPDQRPALGKPSAADKAKFDEALRKPWGLCEYKSTSYSFRSTPLEYLSKLDRYYVAGAEYPGWMEEEGIWMVAQVMVVPRDISDHQPSVLLPVHTTRSAVGKHRRLPTWAVRHPQLKGRVIRLMLRLYVLEERHLFRPVAWAALLIHLGLPLGLTEAAALASQYTQA